MANSEDDIVGRSSWTRVVITESGGAVDGIGVKARFKRIALKIFAQQILIIYFTAQERSQHQIRMNSGAGNYPKSFVSDVDGGKPYK